MTSVHKAATRWVWVSVCILSAGCLDQAPVLDPENLSAEDATLFELLEAYRSGECGTVIAKAPSLSLRRPRRYAAVTYALAQCLYRNDRFLEAASRFEALAGEQDTSRYSIRALYYLGRSYYRGDDLDAAFDVFGAFLRRYPDNKYAIRATHYSGRVRYKQRRFLEAARFFEDARARADGEDQERYRAAATFFAGRSYYRRALEDDAAASDLLVLAKQRVETVIRSFPDSSYLDNAVYARGKVFYKQGAYEDARKVFIDFLDRYPDSGFRPLAHYFWARSLARAGRWVEARARFQEHESLFPESVFVDNALFHQGRSAYFLALEVDTTDPQQAASLLQESEQAFSSVPVRFPQSFYVPGATYYAARTVYSRGDYDRARTMLAPLLQATDSVYYDNALFYDGMSQYRKGKAQDVRAALEGALIPFGTLEAIVPPSFYRSGALYFGGRTLQALGRMSEALPRFESVVAAGDNNAYVDNAYGRLVEVYFDQRRCDEAVTTLNAMRSAVPEAVNTVDGATYDTARCLYETGRYTEAESMFALIARVDRASSDVIRALYFLGRARYRRDDFDAAVEIFEEFRARYPGHPYSVRASYYAGRARYQQDALDSALAYFETTRAAPESTAEERFIAAATFYASRTRYSQALADPPNAALRLTQALELTNDVLARFPTSSYMDNAAYFQGKILYRQERWDEARTAFSNFLLNYPTSGYRNLAHYFLARSAQGLGLLEEALATFREHETLFPTSSFIDNALFQEGRTAYLLARSLRETDATRSLQFFTEAEAALLSLPSRFPSSSYVPAATYFRARSIYSRTDYTTAQGLFASLLADPSGVYYDNALFYVGMCLYRTARATRVAADYVSALTRYDEVVALQPASFYRAGAWYFGGRALQFLNRTSESLPRYRTLVQTVPTSGYVDNALGRIVEIELARARCAEARAAFDQLQVLVPDSPLILSLQADVDSACPVLQ